MNAATTIALPSLEEQAALLNRRYESLTFLQRLRQLYLDFNTQEVLMTSSFGTKSVFLLHLISRIQPKQHVYFLDTGFHFPETHDYKNELVDRLGLRLIEVQPDREKHQLSKVLELYANQPNRCCFYNKVAPMKSLKAGHSVWLSGLMAYQTPERGHLRIWEVKDGLLKFHPLIDIDEGEFLFHVDRYALPRHPLEVKGYGSIGCTHCTAKGEGRSGRWQGQEKTECGLHIAFSQP